MSEFQKPKTNNREAQLEARIAALERAIQQIPSRFGVPTVSRLSRTIIQPAHGFDAGNVITQTGTGGVWELAEPGFRFNGHIPCGIIESITDDSFHVVFAGEISTADFTPLGFLGASGVLSEAPGHGQRVLRYSGSAPTAYVSIMDEAPAIANVLWDYTSGAVNDYSSRMYLAADAVSPADGTRRVLWNLSSGVPRMIAGAYYVIPVSTGDGKVLYQAVGVALGGYEAINAVVKTASPLAVTVERSDAVGHYPVSNASWNDLSGIDDITTAVLADAAPWAHQMVSLGASEQTFTVGQKIPIMGMTATGSIILAPAIEQFRNYDNSTPATGGQVPTWNSTTKKWYPSTISSLPGGGSVGDVLTRVGASAAWQTPASTSITLQMTASHGIGFNDGTVGPKTATSFTFDFLPVNGSMVGSSTIKGTFMAAGGTGAAGGQYPTDSHVWFPASTARNALLVADASTAFPTWMKAIQLGDTTNAGASLKLWYASGKYVEISASGVLTMYDSAGKQVVIDPATNGFKFTYATGKYVEINTSGKITVYESASKSFVIDTASAGMKFTYASGKYVEFNASGVFTIYESATSTLAYTPSTSSLVMTMPNSNTVTIASADFVGTSKAVKMREVEVCDSTGALKKMLMLASAEY